MLRVTIGVVTAGLIGLWTLPANAAGSAPARAVAAAENAGAAPLTDISAQEVRERQRGGGAPAEGARPRGGGAARHGGGAPPHAVGPRPAGPRSFQPHQAAPGQFGPRPAGPHTATPQSVTPRQFGPGQAAPRVRQGYQPARPGAGQYGRPGTPAPNVAGRGGQHARPRIAGPGLQQRTGPRLGTRLGGSLRLGGRNVNIIRGRHRAYWHGRSRWVLPLSALAAIAIGSATYAPYAYVPVAENYCAGWTEDGCRLRWTWVPTIEGDEIPQCVAFCPY